jgi:hypothetical protein
MIIAVRLQNTLMDLGYPQLPTLLLIDNTVAIGLANDTINKKRSRIMVMRFFWLRDRVSQQQFVVEHIPGQHNVADFFTKALPKSKFDQFHRYLVVNSDYLEGKRPKKKLKPLQWINHCEERVCWNTISRSSVGMHFVIQTYHT